MKKQTAALFASVLMGGLSVVAAIDENGVEPYHWLTFDNNTNNFGSVALTFESFESSFVQTRLGLAVQNTAPYVNDSTIPMGNQPWTLVLTAKSSTQANGILWSCGRKNSTIGLALVSGGDGTVKLCSWTANCTTAATVHDTVAVPTATTAYHCYAVVVDPVNSAALLYVDGVASAAGAVAIPGNPSNWAFQLGGIHSGEGDSGLVKVTAGSSYDDLRVYHQGLTAEQVAAIAAHYPVSTVTEYTAAPTADLVIGANDIAVFKGSFTYDGTYRISGDGLLVVRDGRTTFTHVSTAAVNPMRDFTGTLCVAWKGTAYYGDSGSWAEDADPFGPCSYRLVDDGKIDGFLQRNNVTLTGTVDVMNGTAAHLDSTSAKSGAGCNLTLNGSLKGSGALTLNNNHRQITFKGDNAAYAGEIAVSAAMSYGGVKFGTAGSGSAAAKWTIKTGANAKDITLQHTGTQTIAFGDLVVTDAKSIVIDGTADGTVEVGARGGDSMIDAPFAKNKTVIRKVGAGSLALGARFAAVDGSEIQIAGGCVTSEAAVPCAVTFLDGASYPITAEQDAAGQKVTLLTIADGYTVTGLPSLDVENAGHQGRWSVKWQTNADGSQSLVATTRRGFTVIIL